MNPVLVMLYRDNDTDDALDTHHNDGERTLIWRGPPPIPTNVDNDKTKRMSASTYPMVCWVSTLNRKAVVKSSMLSTHTTCSGWAARYSGSRSRWTVATRNQRTPNRSQETKNEAENQKIVHHQESSIRLVKKSLRNLGWDHLFQSFSNRLKTQTCTVPHHQHF